MHVCEYTFFLNYDLIINEMLTNKMVYQIILLTLKVSHSNLFDTLSIEKGLNDDCSKSSNQSKRVILGRFDNVIIITYLEVIVILAIIMYSNNESFIAFDTPTIILGSNNYCKSSKNRWKYCGIQLLAQSVQNKYILRHIQI